MENIANKISISEWQNSSETIYDHQEFDLRLSSRLLSSGKCQVKFFASIHQARDMYGYVLVEPRQTLKEVVDQIKTKLYTIRHLRDFHHIHLYSIGQHNPDALNFLIFEA